MGKFCLKDNIKFTVISDKKIVFITTGSYKYTQLEKICEIALDFKS